MLSQRRVVVGTHIEARDGPIRWGRAESWAVSWGRAALIHRDDGDLSVRQGQWEQVNVRVTEILWRQDDRELLIGMCLDTP